VYPDITLGFTLSINGRSGHAAQMQRHRSSGTSAGTCAWPAARQVLAPWRVAAATV